MPATAGEAQHGALRRLRCLCRWLVRSDAAPPTIGGRRSRAQQHLLRRKERIFRWGAISCGGPPGLGGDVYQFPLCTQPDLDKSTLPGTGNMTLLTITCLGTVAPVYGGTPCDDDYPWRLQTCTHGPRNCQRESPVARAPRSLSVEKTRL